MIRTRNACVRLGTHRSADRAENEMRLPSVVHDPYLFLLR